MIAISSKAFVAAQVQLRECNKQMHHLNDADDLTDEEYIEQETASLCSSIERLYGTMLIMFESLRLNHSLAEFVAGFKAIRDKLGTLEHFDGQHEFVSNPAINFLRAQLALFAPLIDVPTDMRGKRSVLWTMLKQTPVLMTKQPKPPKREKDVQDALETVLMLAFPDMVREPPIAKQTKVYVPDFGVDSVETAVEIKYLSKASEVGNKLGELYEDMRGYNNAPGYTMFFGLIYMTGSFVTQERVDAEALTTNVPKNWRIQVVTGPGATTLGTNVKKKVRKSKANA